MAKIFSAILVSVLVFGCLPVLAEEPATMPQEDAAAMSQGDTAAATAQEDAAAPAQEAADAATFEVARFQLSTGLQEREPVDQVQVVPREQSRVFAFLEAKKISADTRVTVVWYQGGVEVAQVPLTLRQGTRWRTYSSKNLGGIAGEWTVELRDAQGAVLQNLAFKVVE